MTSLRSWICTFSFAILTVWVLAGSVRGVLGVQETFFLGDVLKGVEVALGASSNEDFSAGSSSSFFPTSSTTFFLGDVLKGGASLTSTISTSLLSSVFSVSGFT